LAELGARVLFDTWRAPDGTERTGAALLTTEANAVVRPVHDPLPAPCRHDANASAERGARQGRTRSPRQRLAALVKLERRRRGRGAPAGGSLETS